MHETARQLFDEVYSASWPARAESIAERRFATIPGAQWEGYWSKQFANRPKLEVNMVHLALIRVEDEWRNNRITVSFASKDGENDDIADTCAALYRADELDSGAREAYDNAVQEAIGGGMGAWRLRAAYDDEYDDDNEKQRIKIEPVYDADQTVFFDLNAKRQDKADAKHCWVLISMTRAAYEDEYGDKVDTWPTPTSRMVGAFDWAVRDVVYVAEYYRVEQSTEKLLTFRDITGEEDRITEAVLMGEVEPVTDDYDKPDDDATLAAAIAQRAAVGTIQIGQKTIKRKKIRKYILGGGSVLEDCGYLPGCSIPIIPVYGKRWYVDNIERFMGHVRLAMDSQRLLNMQLSKMAETAAKAGDAKPIFDPEQMDPEIAQMWADDNIKNYPFLYAKRVLNPDGTTAAMGPIGSTQPAQVPPVTAALIQVAQLSLTELLGSAQAPEAVVSNASGKAVNMTQQRQDARAFIYLDNAAKAMRRCGEIWLEYAQSLYVEEGRKMKGVSAQGSVSAVEIARPIIGPDGVSSYENDISEAKCDVTVDVGPTSSSKRQALVQSLTGVLHVTQDPQQAAVLTAMILRNIEGEGLGDLHEWERKKLLSMGIGKPTDADMAEASNAQPAPPDAQAQFLMASAAREASSAKLNEAKVGLTEAQTVETLHGVQTDNAANNPAMQRPAAQPGNPGVFRGT